MDGVLADFNLPPGQRVDILRMGDRAMLNSTILEKIAPLLPNAARKLQWAGARIHHFTAIIIAIA
jgi:hypothetical protein